MAQAVSTMQALDILVLAQLAADGSKPSARTLGEQLELPPSTLQRSLGRLRQAGLIDGDGVDGSLALEFFQHVPKFLMPARPDRARVVRGLRTGSYVAPLIDEFSPDRTPVVWELKGGPDEGYPVTPVVSEVPRLAKQRPDLRRVLAAVDALRMEPARERRVATDFLSRQLNAIGAFG
jgi:DNA-binding Lrp family transcriptional regulator